MPTLLTTINILAILLSPVVAVVIARWLEDRRARKRFQLQVLQSLLAYRNSKIDREAVAAINVLEFAYPNNSKVRSLFREYMQMLGNSGLTRDVEGWGQIDEKYHEMLAEMARVCGFGKGLQFQDMQRYYSPEGLRARAEREAEMADAFTAFCKRFAFGDQQLEASPANISEPSEAQSDQAQIDK